MNCESWLVPKNELITDERVLALIRSVGVNTSLSLTFILSRIVRAIRAKPTPNWFDNCSPTVRTLRLLKWSISSTMVLLFTSLMRYFIIKIISSFVRTFVSYDVLIFSFLLILNRPTSPRSYLLSEKNNLSNIPLAVSSSGGSAFLNWK